MKAIGADDLQSCVQ